MPLETVQQAESNNKWLLRVNHFPNDAMHFSLSRRTVQTSGWNEK